jgi:hypothetical protein
LGKKEGRGGGGGGEAMYREGGKYRYIGVEVRRIEDSGKIGCASVRGGEKRSRLAKVQYDKLIIK